MNRRFLIALVALGAISIVWAARTPPAAAQAWPWPIPRMQMANNSVWVNFQGRPGSPGGWSQPLGFEWIDFEHAWAAQAGSAPSFQVNPAAQSLGFNSFGRDWQTTTGMPGFYGFPIDVYNSGIGGTVLAQQTQQGFVPLPFNQSRTASAVSGSNSATATASAYMNFTPGNPPVIAMGPSISGSAVGNPGGAYRFASSTTRSYLGWPQMGWFNGQWQWGVAWMITGTSNIAGLQPVGGDPAGGGAPEDDNGVAPPRGRSTLVARVFDATGTPVREETLMDASAIVDWAAEGGVPASIHWETNQLAVSGVQDGEFRVSITSEWVAPEHRGTIDVRVHHGVVTTSRATGVFNTFAPPVGSPGNFTIPMLTAGQFDYNIPHLGPDLRIDAVTSEPDLPATWYGAAGDGNWTTGGNWLYGRTPGAKVPIYLSVSVPGSPTILNANLPIGTVIGGLIFRPEAVGYTLQGINPLTVDGLVQNRSPLAQAIELDMILPPEGCLLDTSAGDIVVHGNVSGDGALRKTGGGKVLLYGANTYAGGTRAEAGKLLLLGQDAHPPATDMTVAAGALVQVPAALPKAVKARGVSVALGPGGGTLDLVRAQLIVDGTVTPPAQVHNQIASGYNLDDPENPWTGPGITSSAAAAQADRYAVGYLLNGELGELAWTTWFGREVNNDSVLVRFTYQGDTDLSGEVTTDDFDNWKQGYVTGLAGWLHGDLDYSGEVTTDDFDLWKQVYIGHYPPMGDGSGGGRLATSGVPEPSTLVLLGGIAAALLAGRWRRRKR